MLIQDHVQQARVFLDAADANIEALDVMQGSEKLWGAATQVIIAAAQQRAWPSGSRGDMRNAVRRLAEEYAEPSLRDWFQGAELCHINFYHGVMDDEALDFARQRVHQFVTRIQELIRLQNDDA